MNTKPILICVSVSSPLRYKNQSGAVLHSLLPISQRGSNDISTTQTGSVRVTEAHCRLTNTLTCEQGSFSFSLTLTRIFYSARYGAPLASVQSRSTRRTPDASRDGRGWTEWRTHLSQDGQSMGDPTYDYGCDCLRVALPAMEAIQWHLPQRQTSTIGVFHNGPLPGMENTPHSRAEPFLGIKAR